MSTWPDVCIPGMRLVLRVAPPYAQDLGTVLHYDIIRSWLDAAEQEYIRLRVRVRLRVHRSRRHTFPMVYHHRSPSWQIRSSRESWIVLITNDSMNRNFYRSLSDTVYRDTDAMGFPTLNNYLNAQHKH
jgi:hypothetical protein